MVARFIHRTTSPAFRWSIVLSKWWISSQLCSQNDGFLLNCALKMMDFFIKSGECSAENNCLFSAWNEWKLTSKSSRLVAKRCVSSIFELFSIDFSLISDRFRLILVCFAGGAVSEHAVTLGFQSGSSFKKPWFLDWFRLIFDWFYKLNSDDFRMTFDCFRLIFDDFRWFSMILNRDSIDFRLKCDGL